MEDVGANQLPVCLTCSPKTCMWGRVPTQTHERTWKHHKQAAGLGIKPATFLLQLAIVGVILRWNARLNFPNINLFGIFHIFSYKTFQAEAYTYNTISWNWLVMYFYDRWLSQKETQGTICLLISPTEIMSPLHSNFTDMSDWTASSFGFCLFKNKWINKQ